ncbi:MAG: ankyrin repeat domain-containing protein [Rhodothalassiaceae bacterium]
MKRKRIFVSLAAALVAILSGVPAAWAQYSTPYELIKAVKDRDYAGIRSLMLKCRCPNARTTEGIPILVIAARNGDTATARFLIESGANVTARAEDTGTNALMEFAQRGNLDGVRLLMENGADPDAGDNTGQTALIYAVRARKARVIRVLLEAGANPDMADYQGRTPLDVARQMRYRDIEKLFADAS